MSDSSRLLGGEDLIKSLLSGGSVSHCYFRYEVSQDMDDAGPASSADAQCLALSTFMEDGDEDREMARSPPMSYFQGIPQADHHQPA